MGQRTYHSAVDAIQPSPRIGLTTYREPAAWGVWSEPADLLPTRYANAVTAAGGVAMLLPPAATGDLDTVAAVALDGLHGLALAGGADVEPVRYLAHRDVHTGDARPDRDAWELALARVALDRGLPVFGICRGMQVLNVALGGDLVQHLPDVVGHDGHAPVVGVHGRHDVRLLRESEVGALLGDCAVVATYHHQSVCRLGAGLVATGWAGDDTVEALEHTGTAWVVGVQWHPEVHDGAALFAAFVQAGARYRAALAPVGSR
jgi:putative glutamine amidotransferase